MENLTSAATAATEPKTFDMLIHRLELEVNNAKENSNFLYEKVSKLSNFTLICDGEKAEKLDINGHLDSISEMISTLEFFNRRNSEILKYLDTII